MTDRSAQREDRPTIAGGAIPATGWPAYRLELPPDMPVPVLIAAPHGGRAYPDELLARMRDAEAVALRLEDRYIDAVASDLASETGAALLVAEAPRALLDLNRASDDMDWEMVVGGAERARARSLSNRRSRSGLGLVPRRLSGSGEIWKTRMQRCELDARIAGVHQPYHLALGQTLERIRDRWGAALLIDLHSMPPLKRRFPHEKPPEFVVGDRFGASCDYMLTARALDFLGRRERGVAHNRPYAGGYVLDRHAQPTRGIHAIQLEICRSTYLDARLAEPSARLPAVVRVLAGLVRDLAACTAGLACDRGLPLAAE